MIAAMVVVVVARSDRNNRTRPIERGEKNFVAAANAYAADFVKALNRAQAKGFKPEKNATTTAIDVLLLLFLLSSSPLTSFSVVRRFPPQPPLCSL